MRHGGPNIPSLVISVSDGASNSGSDGRRIREVLVDRGLLTLRVYVCMYVCIYILEPSTHGVAITAQSLGQVRDMRE